VHLLQETDVIVNQVLDELGISLDQELSGIIPGLDKPHIQQTTNKKQLAPAGAETDDLQARLDNLRRGGDDDN
jgi:charged multivesicular body protein 2A